MARTTRKLGAVIALRFSGAVVATMAGIGAAVLAPTPVPPLASGQVWAATSWQASQLPVPAGADKNGSGYAGPIACPAVGRCVVLGEYSTPTGAAEDLIATQADGKWSAVRAPLPAGAIEATNLGPYVLRCTGVGNCVGTSLYETSTAVRADILDEINGQWMAISIPTLANESPGTWPTINAMACPLRGACVIAGTYLTTSGLSEGLLITQEGTNFAVAESPTPGVSNRGAGLSGVACLTPSSCVAVGYFVTASADREGFLVADAGGALTPSVPPLPGNAAPNPLASLQSVSCGSSTLCVALGAYENPDGYHLGFIDTFASGKWTASKMPTPSGSSATSPSQTIYGVACKGGTYCLAVGQYLDSSGKTQGLALLEQADRWSASMMPGTANLKVEVGTVACASETSCGAAGHYVTSRGQVGYLMTLSGSTLSGSTSPLPSDADSQPGVGLGFITCPWIATCTASGTYQSGSPAFQLPVAVSD